MQTTDPHTTDPHTTDPHTTDPHTTDPPPTDPHRADPVGAPRGATGEPAGIRPIPSDRGDRYDRLHRSRDHRMLAGVADGLADYFDVDTTLVRVGFVALALFGGLAVPLYLAGWLLIPEEGSDRSMVEELLGRGRLA